MGERFFSGEYGVSREELDEYGAFDISLLTDLPLFIDPFLLFNSSNPKYRALHEEIIHYLQYLCEKSACQVVNSGLVQALYAFPEVSQTWLGFAAKSNRGLGLGRSFAQALNRNLGTVLSSFGSETVTRSSHIEKLCLIEGGVGRDKISDFVTNLILGYLAEYTQTFAEGHIAPDKLSFFPIRRSRFNYSTGSWENRTYRLPSFGHTFVILTPKDLLTKDDTWINRSDLADYYNAIPDAIPDVQLRALVNEYFASLMPTNPKEAKKEKPRVVWEVARRYPVVIDYYIRDKELDGDRATSVSQDLVRGSEQLYVEQFGELAAQLDFSTAPRQVPVDSFAAVLARARYLKHVVEDCDGYRLFYVDGQPIHRESDLHILYRLTWFDTAFDVNQEVNNGRGPIDYAVSMGSHDKTLVEFKIASNSKLKQNLQAQLPVYERASDTQKSIEVIFFFTASQEDRVRGIMNTLHLNEDDRLILVDARSDNKPSGSVAEVPV